MTGMSRNNATSSLQGFSVFQPALGSTLQWLPALGSHELDELVHTFLPGPASIQDKRAHISMDFFEFSRQTGETFKFYPVYAASFASTATASPASSSAMHDSGYGSSFNVSPVVSSTSPWTPSFSPSTPASATADSQPRSRSGPSQRTTSSAGSRRPMDFSNHPGMRILTKDGRDITNSASRGCKSKEQRDHAHLMRIIKACEACRRKKIRCDPSHKKRTSSQTQPARSDPKQAKKPKAATSESVNQDFSLATPSALDFVPSFGLGMTAADAFEGLGQNPDDFWQQFVHFDGQGASFPGEYGLFMDPAGYITSSNGSSSASPAQSFPPSTPGLAENYYGGLPELVSQEPALPYLNPGDSYGTNYQDFNLYSPTSELEGLDEEPQSVRKPSRRKHASSQDEIVESSLSRTTPEPPNIDSPAGLYGGQNHQHGDPIAGGVSDWHRVPADDSISDMHEAATTITHSSSTHHVASRGRPRPHTLPSSSLRPAPALAPASLATGTPSSIPAPSTTYASASTSTSWLQPDHPPSSINGQLCGSRPADVHDPLPAVSQDSRVRIETPVGGLAQRAASRLAQAVAHPQSNAHSEVANSGIFAPALQQPASISLRRGLFSRSAFVLEPNDYSDLISRDRASFSHPYDSVSHEFGWNTGSDGPDCQDGPTVSAGLREAPHAHYAPSSSGLPALPRPGRNALLADVVVPPSPTPLGVPGVPSQSCRLSLPSTTAPGLNTFAVLGVVSCLIILLMRWASLGWQLELLLAVSLSASSCRRPTHGHNMGGISSAATMSAASLQSSFRKATTLSLLALSG